jgi:Cu+-exporting ATPase
VKTVATSGTAASNVGLEIAGMTCASCAIRIEKKLNKLDGVNATVNYATETATVTVPAEYDSQALIAEVEKAGYTAACRHSTKKLPPSRPVTTMSSPHSAAAWLSRQCLPSR